MLPSPSLALSRYYGRVPTTQLPSFCGEPGRRLSARVARPLSAVNNQHSHIEEELVRMQSQLLVAPQTPGVESQHKPSQPKHRVFHDTELHPYPRQHNRRVQHNQHEPLASSGFGSGSHTAELTDAVELSYQYSSNIVNYRTDTAPEHYQPQQQYQQTGMPATPLPRPAIHRARVVDYRHPSVLAKEVVSALLSEGKLLLELPDEPSAVSSLLIALGRAAAKLRSVGLATALDPVCDSSAAAHSCNGSCHSSGSTNHGHSHGHGSTNHGHSHGSSNGGGGSPTSSHDVPGSNQRRADSCPFVLCARAVPIPPAATASSATSAATYSVGSSMGQEVLRVGPSIGVHTLLPALLGAVLRDGLVTLRCCWFDEEADSDAWSDDEALAEHYKECDITTMPARSGSPGSCSPAPSLEQHNPAGSLVRVPCILRAIFKLDRQLRGLDLGGLVLLPHTFMRPGRCINTQVLYLDVVIA